MAKAATRAELARRQQLWQGANRETQLNGMFLAMSDEGKRATGLSVSVASASGPRVGLPLPALALRYLFQSTMYPLGTIAQITGEEGCCKTAFMNEVFRWHLVYGGGAVFVENEGKDAPELRGSLLGWNQSWLNRVEVVYTHTLEDWMDALTAFTQIAARYQDSPDGPGRTIPIAFGIDSIMGTAPRAQLEKILEAGHASRDFALAALLISQYMRTMPNAIKTYPFSVLGTNHLKPSTDYMGRPVNNIGGGKSVKFMEVFEVEMHKAPGCDIDRLEYGGLRLSIILRKNSLGPSRKRITAELLWWLTEYQDAEGRQGFRQQTAWDWDTASIELLLSFENMKGKRTIYNHLMDVCDIRVANKGNRTGWSRALGVPESDPQEFRVLGSKLEQRPDLLQAMYPLLGITPRIPFQPGMDFRRLLAEAVVSEGTAGVDLYERVENMPQLQPTGTDECEVPEVPDVAGPAEQDVDPEDVVP
jgi:RecA/RadA recombinase